MIPPLEQRAWPASRLGEALQLLGRRSGLPVKKVEALQAPMTSENGLRLEEWIHAVSESIGLEAEAVETVYAKIDEMIGNVGPAIVLLPDCAESRFLVVWKGNRRRLSLLTPDLATAKVPTEIVTDRLRAAVEAPRADDVERIVVQAGLHGHRADRARQSLFNQLMASSTVGGCWIIRAPCSVKFVDLAREAGLPSLFFRMMTAHTIEYSLWIGSWWLLGWISMVGRFDPGLLAAWFLMLLSVIPFRLLTTSTGARIAISTGVLLKRRLLFGALKLPGDSIRVWGAGQLLGRVNESEVVEELALVGGMLGLTALVELAIAVLVLGFGARSWVHVLLLLVWLAITCGIAARLYFRQRGWTQARLDMTNDLTERMVGHRTRLVQQNRARWNADEDPALEQYLDLSAKLDHTAAALRVLVPRGWLIAGIAGLVPEFVFGDPAAPRLAATLGGVILAARSFKNLAEGIHRLSGAGVAWGRIKVFWDAAASCELIGEPAVATAVQSIATDSHFDSLDPNPLSRSSGQPMQNGRPLIDARQLAFGYPDRLRPVLNGIDLRVDTGERLILEGPSGGGKSTLASILAGIRVADGGLLLLDGLDRATLGSACWRRRVAMIPQFHENHVLMGSFAFNALLGRGWPPRPGDVQQAEAVCRRLGLGPLLDRMPAGMQQMVGETGWQLSHGEKSRLFMARALLQRAECLILDESFAALDPETLHVTLRYVLETAPTLLVIAHP